jgi:hypothetical protein
LFVTGSRDTVEAETEESVICLKSRITSLLRSLTLYGRRCARAINTGQSCGTTTWAFTCIDAEPRFGVANAPGRTASRTLFVTTGTTGKSEEKEEAHYID